MGNEFGGLSCHHFLALMLLQWVCTIIMLDFVDSCMGDSMTWFSPPSWFGFEFLPSMSFLDLVDFV